jgi:pimeloyl-ACP methyl ester carboxylesterase
LLLTCGALSAQNEPHRIRNIVLVHGAWADGSGWKGVYDILIKDGYNVSIVQEPETSFKDDVAATKRVLAQQDGSCILVAHSYGGAVITEAGTDPLVAGLVYIAADRPGGIYSRTTGSCHAVKIPQAQGGCSSRRRSRIG